jgi:hypothetical protein
VIFLELKGANFRRHGRRLRRLMRGVKNFAFTTFLHIYFQKTLGGISYNVPAVYDIFAVAGNVSSNRKNVPEKNAQRP